MDSWWSGMEWFERVLWIIAIPSTLFFLIQLILSFIGADADMEADFTGDLDGDIGDAGEVAAAGDGFAVFTIRGFITFMTVFSWSGITFYHEGFSNFATLAISVVLGLAAMFMVAGIYYFFNRMTESGTLDLKNAINHTGQVYLPIQAARGNIGKVQITIQGSLRELNAMTDSAEDLSTGTVVIVSGILQNSILLVKKQ